MTSKVFTDNPSGPGTPVDIPLYRSHKIVAAAPIIEFDIHRLTLDIGDGARGLAVIEPDMFARYTPVPGDYFVQYEDGYCSISPKDAFEAGYSAVSADEVKSKDSPFKVEPAALTSDGGGATERAIVEPTEGGTAAIGGEGDPNAGPVPGPNEPAGTTEGGPGIESLPRNEDLVIDPVRGSSIEGGNAQ